MELNHNKKILNEKQGKKRNSDASYLRDKQQEETLTKKYEAAQVYFTVHIKSGWIGF